MLGGLGNWFNDYDSVKKTVLEADKYDFEGYFQDYLFWGETFHSSLGSGKKLLLAHVWDHSKFPKLPWEVWPSCIQQVLVNWATQVDMGFDHHYR